MIRGVDYVRHLEQECLNLDLTIYTVAYVQHIGLYFSQENVT